MLEDLKINSFDDLKAALNEALHLELGRILRHQ